MILNDTNFLEFDHKTLRTIQNQIAHKFCVKHSAYKLYDNKVQNTFHSVNEFRHHKTESISEKKYKLHPVYHQLLVGDGTCFYSEPCHETEKTPQIFAR